MPLLGTRGAASASGYGRAAQGGLPVGSPDIWYKSEDLAGYSEGSSITTWPNRGIYGSNQDLIYSSLANTPGTPSAPLKYSVGGKPGCYFDGGNRLLYMRNYLNSPTSNPGYFFDGDTSNGTTPLDRTMFFVYYWSGSGHMTPFGAYQGNYSSFGQGHSYGNIGFCYSTPPYYGCCESNDGWSFNNTSCAPDTTVVAQAGHRQPAGGGTVYFWKNKTPTYTTQTYTNQAASNLHAIGMGNGRPGYYNNGYLFEVIIYGRQLNDGEITLMRNYLGAKYGGTANT